MKRGELLERGVRHTPGRYANPLMQTHPTRLGASPRVPSPSGVSCRCSDIFMRDLVQALTDACERLGQEGYAFHRKHGLSMEVQP
jgi:hypothetical protein